MCQQSTKLASITRRDRSDIGANDSDNDDVEPTATAAQLQSSGRCGNPRPLCPTRVLCRGPALRAVTDNVECLLDALQQYADESNEEPATKAHAMMVTTSKFTFL